MFLFFSRTVAEALNINDGAMWRHFWKIPLFPTLFGMLYCFTDDVRLCHLGVYGVPPPHAVGGLATCPT